MVLAIVVVPLVLRSVVLGLRDKRERHRRISRWTWPLWMYVSVTGLVVYLMLYPIADRGLRSLEHRSVSALQAEALQDTPRAFEPAALQP